MTPWTAAHQAPLSMGFSRQGYWSGLLFPSPGDLPSPGREPSSCALLVDSLPLSHLGSPNDSDVFNNHIFLGPIVSAKMENSINIGLLNRDQHFFFGKYPSAIFKSGSMYALSNAP